MEQTEKNPQKFVVWHSINEARFSLAWGSFCWGVCEEVLNCVTVHLTGKIQISFRT